jgi:DNA-binding transcriptional LysR family regulator
MEMHQIRYFLAACDAGNFTRASEASNVSQPSLTLAIGKLEAELGGRLFERDRSGCRLTDLGRVVEPDLRRILEQSQAVKAEATRFVRLKKVPLRLGLPRSIGPRRIAPALARFQKAHPRVEVEVMVDAEERLRKRVGEGGLDLALGASADDPGSALRREPLFSESYVVAFAAGHDFARRDSIRLADLQSEAWLDRLQCEMRENLRAELRGRDLALYAAYRSNDDGWILRMVEAGIGVAVLPEDFVPAGESRIACRPLRDPAIERVLHAITPAWTAPKPEALALIKAIRASARPGP